ncbi:MAG: 16S rRNA methyltransferase [Acidobacteria bacterium]|nr:16S rRNA methyltransferase [Acidobacteriota bacterium]|tara:strand:- start:1012 stop:1899 length:888 start_codon:yes stop_codon:yes gene_type:complete
MILHEPVLRSEVTQLLAPEGRGLVVDCTVGSGGHTQALLEAGATKVLGLDRDPEVLALARKRLAPWAGRAQLVHADYRSFESVLDDRGLDFVDGAVADFGHSTIQLESEGRGFSFRREDPLDMRMDRSQGPTLAERLADIDADALADVIYEYGEERHSRRIARSIIAARDAEVLSTTTELATAVRRAIRQRGYRRIDPATRTFQALRIWVNDELDGLERFLRAVANRLRAGARLAIISFHSLEDRIVKYTLRELEGGGDPAVRVLTRRPLRPDADEVQRNPRARSAKLRALERMT